MNDELLVSYLLGEAPPPLRSRVEQWIRSDSAHQRYFDHFQLIWNMSRQIKLPPSISEEDAWQRFQQRTARAEAGAQTKEPGVVRSMPFAFNWFRVAAILILCISVLSLFYVVWDKNTSKPVTVAAEGSAIEQALPDGSTVILNKHASITYAGKMKGKERRVELNGEAFFKVVPDKTKPFVVSVNDITVTVVGTAFNVKHTGDETEIIVESGIVKVARNDQTITLQAGEKTLIKATNTQLEKQESTDQLYNYYRSKSFVCDNTPLWRLAETLGEAYGVKIIIENKELRDYPLTATFHEEPLDNILSVIAETFDITVSKTDQTIILK